MTVTVRVHDVVATQDARQSPANGGIIEDLADFGYEGKEVVAERPMAWDQILQALINAIVQTVGQVRLHDRIAVDQEPSHALIVEDCSGVCRINSCHSLGYRLVRTV